MISAPMSTALLYFADFTKDRKIVENMPESGKMIVETGILHQPSSISALRDFPLEKLLKLAELFNFPSRTYAFISEYQRKLL